jgi:hypothetical protein
MRLRQYLTEEVSRQDLKTLEKTLDALFKSLNIDIEFTKHFLDRVNDNRNKPNIKFAELQAMFRKTYARYADKLKSLPDGAQRVLHDLQTDINVPFVIDINKRGMDLISKTVMRKKNFKSSNQKLKV